MKVAKAFFKRRGAMAVEAALVLPIIVMLTFAVFKYGWIIYKYQQVANTARQVARVAIRPGDRTAEIATIFTAVTVYKDADGVEHNRLPGASYKVTPLPGAQTPRTPVTVEVSVPVVNIDIANMPDLLPMPANFTTLSSRVTMCKEG